MTFNDIAGFTRIALALMVTVGSVRAQVPTGAPAAPQFEVASVKPFPGGGRGGRPSGGPGDSQFSWPGASLANLIARAYMVNGDQVTGPGWISSEMYSMAVKISEGASAEEFSAMMQNLLLERFQMTMHRETKVVNGYDLVIAKGGAKLRPSVAANGGGEGHFGPDGADLTYTKTTMQSFANMLAMRIRVGDLGDRGPMDAGAPSIVRIVDKTGLMGDYDIKLHYGLPRNDTPGEDILSAVESQLGLSLKAAKISVDMVVVDRAEKIPTDN